MSLAATPWTDQFDSSLLRPRMLPDLEVRPGRSRPATGLTGIHDLMAGCDQVSKHVQSLVRASEQMVRSHAASQNPDVLREMLHLRARLDGMVQQAMDARQVLERLSDTMCGARHRSPSYASTEFGIEPGRYTNRASSRYVVSPQVRDSELRTLIAEE